MYWTASMISQLEDAPWPATISQLIEYADLHNVGIEIMQNLQEIKSDEENEEDEVIYHSIEELVPDMPEDDAYFFDEEE